MPTDVHIQARPFVLQDFNLCKALNEVEMAITQLWAQFPMKTIYQVLQILIQLLVAWQIVSTLAQAVYNLCFHPLRRFPGPKLWIAFPIIKIYYLMRGTLDFKLREQHDRYGHVVRSSPDFLSFTSASAWKDIYGYGHPELPKQTVKDSTFNANQIIAAPAAEHSRMRRAMAPAFSDKALGQQEGLIMQYVDLLVQRLREASRSGKPTDMVRWSAHPVLLDL